MEIFIFIIAVIIYFIPSWVGSNHRNFGAIFTLNLLLGWTFIGWIVALIWAMSNGAKTQTTIIKNEIKPSKSDELIKLKKLVDEGLLTPEEFQLEKSKILNS